MLMKNMSLSYDVLIERAFLNYRCLSRSSDYLKVYITCILHNDCVMETQAIARKIGEKRKYKENL